MGDSSELELPARYRQTSPDRLANLVARSNVRVRDLFVNPTAVAYASIGELGEYNFPHTHEFIEFVIVVSGRGTHRSARGTSPMVPGAVIVVRPGAWHDFSTNEDLVVAIVGISLNTLRSDLSFLRSRAATRDLLYVGPGTADRGIRMIEISRETVGEIADRVRRLERLLKEKPDASLVALGDLIAVLGMISSGIPVSEAKVHVHPAVAEMLDLLDEAPERNWRSADLGAAVNLDVAYLTRIFREHMGVPPMAYLARVRAEKAAHLLASTDLPIAQVGARVGWRNPSYFARRFQTHIGLIPSDYRRHIQAGGTAVIPDPPRLQ